MSRNISWDACFSPKLLSSHLATNAVGLMRGSPGDMFIRSELSHGVGWDQFHGLRFSHRLQGLGVRFAALEAGRRVVGDDVAEHLLQRASSSVICSLLGSPLPWPGFPIPLLL